MMDHDDLATSLWHLAIVFSAFCTIQFGCGEVMMYQEGVSVNNQHADGGADGRGALAFPFPGGNTLTAFVDFCST